jgi:nucleoside-diphosphate-sugar epimerase
MRILVTGADRPLGAAVARSLRGVHDIRATGQEGAAAGLEGVAYAAADLREPDAVKELMEGVDAVAHLALHAPLPTPDWQAERWALDWAARGTYVLMQAALAAGVGRVVLASRLDLLAPYPETALVDETWKPLPRATAASLAPYLAELTVREFVRAEPIAGICLRLGDLGDAPDGTKETDAVAAVTRALSMELPALRWRWWLYHVGSGGRYPLSAAARLPLAFTPGGA